MQGEGAETVANNMMEHLCLPHSHNWATPNNIYNDDYDTNDSDDDDYVKLNQHGGTRVAQRLFFLQNVYSRILNSTTRVIHVLSHCPIPYGFLANTFIPIVFWVYFN